MIRRRSAVETYDGCPFRYKRVHIDGLLDQGDESRRGLTFHQAALNYIMALAAAQLPADAELADTALTEALRDQPSPTHLLDEIRRIWKRFTEWFQLDLLAYYAAEEGYESRVWRFIPDLVYIYPQGPHIKDWKTFYKGLTRKQAAKEFQLKVYLLAALDVWPNFPTYTFEFVFVRLGYSVTLVFTPEQIEQWRPEVEGVLQNLEQAERTGEYPPIPGSHCTLCRLDCPLQDQPGKLPARILSVAERDKFAGQWLVLEQRLKAIKKALKAEVMLHGPFTLKGQEFLFRRTAIRQYPAATVIEMLRARGGDAVADALLVSHLSLGAADRRHLLDYKELDRLKIETTSETFKHRKAGAVADDDDDED